MLKQTAKIADKYAKDNGLTKVESIQIEVGQLSGALPYIFYEYFNYVAKDYPCLKDAKLEIIETVGEGLCNDCHALFNIVEYEGKCPRCGSQNKKILSGTDIRLISITGI